MQKLKILLVYYNSERVMYLLTQFKFISKEVKWKQKSRI
nr:MAG TPA: hypothetical protein [Caudoviricetes sp.]